MSRVIKFRALRDDMADFNFYYGQLVYKINPISGLYDPYITNNGETYISCLRRTEGQFTGLYDKDGKEIYDGDIVFLSHWKSSDLFDYSRPFLVKWESGQINFKQEEYNNFIGSLNGKLKIEIIGNIHQNPELL